MYEKINLKDIVALNQGIGETGEFQNRASLEYALSMINERKSWLHELSFLTRSIIIDHAFKDGNKRTSLALVLAYFAEHDINYDRERAVTTILTLAKKNTGNINKIARLIKNVIIY